MTIINDKHSYKFDDYILLPKPSNVNSRSEVNLEVELRTKHSRRILKGIPVFCANMAAIAGIKMAKALTKHKMFTCLHKFVHPYEIIELFSSSDTYRHYVFYTTGMKDVDLDRFYSIEDEIIDEGSEPIKLICLDVANGYISKFVDFVKKFREYNPDKVIMAGNVCTPEGCIQLINAGADIIKLNIGTGAQCLTSNKAAVGRSSMQAILECKAVCKYNDVLLVSDGGYSDPAKIAKGLACGADGIMCGTLFAGYDENCGEFITEETNLSYIEAFNAGFVKSSAEFYNKKAQGHKFVTNKIHGLKLYGMSSKYANDKFCGGLKTYRTSEGRETIVPYKGSVELLIQDIKGSLASTCTYLGINDLKDISRVAVFERK